MSGFGSKTTRRQEQAITALLTCATITDAATQCEVSESTIRRWFRDPDFSAAYREARSRMLEAAINALRNESATAVAVLTGIAKDEKASAAVRVTASRVILEMSLRSAELQDVEERLTALEETHKTRQKV